MKRMPAASNASQIACKVRSRNSSPRSRRATLSGETFAVAAKFRTLAREVAKIKYGGGLLHLHVGWSRN